MLFAALLLPLAAAAPSSWFQPEDTPVAALFKRADNKFPDPNSPDWASHYPPAYATPNATTLPKAWVDKLASIKLPDNNPVASKTGCCTIRYNVNGKTTDGMDPSICSFTAGCHTDNDLFLGPDGVFVLTFDDGPTDGSNALYGFLTEKNITSAATHFMIGGNILGDPKTMQAAFTNGGHIAVHTWSHQYTTSLSNEGVLAELGWTMQIIHDLTGGRLPAFWRPPYGDTDNRVRAIAEQVFGMKTVLWNKDTNDWAIGSKPDITVDSVKGTMQQWFTGPKSPGLLALEHELNQDCVNVFMGQYDAIFQNGWQVKSVADAFNMHWYQNAHGNTGDVSMAMNVSEISTNLNATAALPSPTPSATPSPSAAAGNGTSASGASSASASSTKEAGNAQNNKNPGNAGSALVVPGAGVVVAALAALAAL